MVTYVQSHVGCSAHTDGCPLTGITANYVGRAPRLTIVFPCHGLIKLRCESRPWMSERRLDARGLSKGPKQSSL